MLVKGTYTSVWDDEIYLTSDIEADTETHTFELSEMPKDVPGIDVCTNEYITLPWNRETQKVDPEGDITLDFPACQEDQLRFQERPELYYTYE